MANLLARIKNLTFVTVAAQVGCITLVIIFLALFAGLWLDARTGRRGVFTVILLILSAPVSLFITLRIALNMVSRIQLPVTDVLSDEVKEG